VVKPLKLLRYLCRLTKTPTGGVILDPFMGSGSTLLAARAEGRPAIGIDQDEHACEIAVKRLEDKTIFSVSKTNKKQVKQLELNIEDS
jgi:site-specific DNA-methyltransferase (adenine-specific)